MKTLVIIIAILAITTVVYGFSDEERQRNIENLKKCSQEKGGTFDAPSVEALLCAAEMYGKVFNENGEYIRDATLKSFENFISDAAALEEVQRTYSKCHDEADQSGTTGRQQALQIATCILPVASFMAKP